MAEIRRAAEAPGGPRRSIEVGGRPPPSADDGYQCHAPQASATHAVQRAVAQGLPIGSGVVEAACKTLVSQRLKLSGMRWSNTGAQAVLTARGRDQGERFDEAWALLAATYKTLSSRL